eukprot:9180286-Alexandrium_andersonii.AAC.1
MSASLVGSEMCIRDRLTRSCCQARPCRQQIGVNTRSVDARLVSTQTIVAVSYTHLTLPTICSV